MNKNYKNPPIILMVILIILITSFLIVKTGSDFLTKDNITLYLKEQKTILPREFKNDMEAFLIEKDIPIEIVEYIDNSKYLKDKVDKLILAIFDYYNQGEDLSLLEDEIIVIVKNEVERYEKDFNIEIWSLMEKEVKDVVNEAGIMYEQEIPAKVGIFFKIFSANTWQIILFITIIIMSLVFMLKGVWAFLYWAGSFIGTFLFFNYLISNIEPIFRSYHIERFDSLIKIAKDIAIKNNLLVLYASIVLAIIFIIIQILIYVHQRSQIKKATLEI